MKSAAFFIATFIGLTVTPALANEAIKERFGNGVTYIGKWGGKVHASVELISASTLRACYGEQPCFEDVTFRISDDAVVVENGPHKWVYRLVAEGFDASYFKDGSKLSEASLR